MIGGFKTFLILYVIRVINSFCIKTYLHPDEYWQNIEPAHLFVYGYGGQTWEWKGDKPIRSPSYHLIFAFFYYILKLLGLEHPFLIAYGPRLFIQPIFGALMDIYIIKYTRQFFGEKYVYFAILANFTMYLSLAQVVRTYANSIEATVFIISLYYWSKSGKEHNKIQEIISRCLITLNFLFRATALMPWPLPFLMRLVLSSKNNFKTNFIINVCHAILSVLIAIIIDSIYYGKVVFSAYNFFEWNFTLGLAKHYGESPFLYFFYYGIPVSVMLWIPFLYFGYFLQIKQFFSTTNSYLRDVPVLLMFTVLFLSCSEHKEVRFLLGIYPLFPIYAALGFVAILEVNSKILRKLTFLIIPLIVLSNYVMVIDHGFFNYCGSLRMMDYIRDYPKHIDNIVFLTKCNDSPFYAHTHKNFSMVMPNCDPDIGFSEEFKLYHETETFLPEFVKAQNPSHIIVSSTFWDNNYEMRNFLEKDMNFIEEKRFLQVLRPFHILKNFGLKCQGEYLQFLIFLRKKHSINELEL